MDKYLHSISLLLLMVVIAVSLLEVLGLATARYDLALSRRQADMISSNQGLVNRAEEALRESSFPAGESTDMVFSDDDGHSLHLTVRNSGDGATIAVWKSVTEWNENRRIGNLIRTGETGDEQ